MFKTKKDVDRHVRVSLSKLRSENEKYLRGFTIAKLYYKINEYETAEQHVIGFLSVKGDSAPAYKLLGECYLQLKKPEKALSAFQRSLQIDTKQPELLKEVCKLLLSNEISLNTNTVKYWCDLAESEKVQDDAVFNLKLKLINKDNLESKQVEQLIMKEIVSRPTDPKLRVRLIKHFLDRNKIMDAFEYAFDLEMDHNNITICLDWYNTVWLVLTEYKQSSNCKKDWKFWLFFIICLERRVFLTLSNDTDDDQTHKLTESTNLLFNFDKYLLEASQCVLTLCPERELAVQFLNHFRGQYCLHAATLLFYREQIEKKNQWRETTKNALPLLLFAYHCGPPDCQEFWLKRSDEQTKQLIQLWNREGAFRCAQAGRTFLSCIEDKDLSVSSQVRQVITDRTIWTSIDDLLSQIRQLCSASNWRNNLFHMLFTNFDQLSKTKSSYLINCTQLAEPTFDIPANSDIELYEETAQYLRPQFLSYMVYLCLGSSNLADIHCKFFNGLNFSSQNLLVGSPESLNQLDIDTFLYAATIQAKRKIEVAQHYYEDYSSRNAWRPQILPYANLLSNLWSEEQNSWWTAAYKVYKSLAMDNLADLRATLQYGIEAVRCINGPKLDLIIVFKLGQIFINRAQDAMKPMEKKLLEARAEKLFKYGLNMLKLHQKNVLEPFRKLFKYAVGQKNSIVESEINSLAEEAITYLSARYFKSGEYEECVEELSGIQLPFATYFQAEAYLKMDESNKTPKKNKKLYAERAKDCLNQTLNLLSVPSVGSNHPLNSVVQSQIRRLQQNNKYLSDSFSNGYQNEDLIDDTFTTKTPVRSKREILTSSPKSVELENLVRQMNNTLSFLKEELTQVIKSEVSSVRRDFLEFKEKLSVIEDNMKKKSEPPSSDEAANVLEDLCRMDDDLQSQNYSNQPSLYLNFNQQQPRIHTPNAIPPPVNPYNSPLYNTNYPMNYYAQYMMPTGASAASLPTAGRAPLGLNAHVPFVDQTMNFNLPSQPPIQMPTAADTRPNLMGILGQQVPSQTILDTPLVGQQPNSLTSMWNRIYNSAPVEKGLPNNVVITSSDPLPPHTSISQQSTTLSVTIPIQHIKSNSALNDTALQNCIHHQQQSNFSMIGQGLPFAGLNISSTKTTSSLGNVGIPATIATTCVTNVKNKNDVVKATELFNKMTTGESIKAGETEYDISPDFKPINSSGTSEVKTKAFKESTDVLFSSQAKIFKLIQNDWKEQGVGSLKILKSKLDAVVHIILWDNTQKICDLVITSNTQLTPYNNDEKWYMLTALDTVGTQKLENFKVKFKNADAAKQFHRAFMNVQKGIKNNDEKPKEPKKPEVEKKTDTTPSPFSFNFGKATTLTNVKPESAPTVPISTLTANISPFSGFSFSKSTIVNETTANKPFANLFSGLNKSQMETSIDKNGNTKTSPPKDVSNKNQNLNVSGENVEEDDYVPTAQFKPVIPLPDLVEPQTGEENETILFEYRAKLLRFDTIAGEWKERGVGNIKLLVNNDDPNRLRLLMRREAVLKLCCNQRVTKNLKFNKFPNNDAVLSWAGQDYSENELRTELFSIRFKTSEVCRIFHDAILKAQEKMSKETIEDREKSTQKKITDEDTEPVKGFGNQFKPATGSWDCPACYLSNKPGSIVCVACSEPKQKSDKQPEAAHVFKSAPTTEKAKEAETENKVFEGFGDKFKPKPGSWSCKACYVSNVSDVLHCVACDASKDDTVPKKEPKNIFNTPIGKSGFAFGFSTPEITKPSSGTTFSFGTTTTIGNSAIGGFTFGIPKSDSTSAISNTQTVSFPVVTSSTSNDTTPKFNTTANKTFGFTLGSAASQTLIFDVSTTSETTTTTSSTISKPAFSFNTPDPKDKTDSFNLEKQEFQFVLKPKSPGKMKSPLKNVSGVEDESDTENVEEENNTYFTPVIPLPDKIDVKTGEENEEVLYCHRAKLYRFVESEWKERGLGDVKILCHTGTKKLRVVMRREQVLKICLNHALNDEVDYKRKDDKSWLFVVNDFSEGEIELMQFCLRFKTPEIADNFIKAIKDILSGTSDPIANTKQEDSRESTPKNVDITDSDKTLADKLQLPYSFYDNHNETKCTGCCGCEPDEFIFPDYVNNDKETDQRPPLPLEMPKFTKQNNMLIKQSTFSFSKLLPSKTDCNESKSIFGGGNILSAKENADKPSTLQPLAGSEEHKFIFNLGQTHKDKKEENKSISGGFIFGNPMSFGNADKAKPSFGQMSVFGGTGNALGTAAASSDNDKPPQPTTFSTLIFPSSENKGGSPFQSGSGQINDKENTFVSSKPTFSFATSSTSMFSGTGQTIFSGATPTNTIGTTDKSVEQQNAFKDPGISSGNLTSTFNVTQDPEKKNTEEEIATEDIFKNDPGLSFASLAKGADVTSTFRTSQNTSEFVGLTGDDAFNNFLSPKKNGTPNKNTTEGNAEDDSNYDPHYEPIIELPQEIVVSTGEENEEKLFGERAFLYRYDSVNKEWKERGVGELKLLHHPGQGTYRLLLRREQIHKLVLNHAITDSFQLNQMNNSGKAFCWATMNYAEEDGQLEKLAARFKNVDIAHHFEAEVKKCINQLKKRADLEPEED